MMSLVLQDQLVLSPATADHLQEEIDAIEAGSDVTDVVGTYEDLENYDTSKLTDNDIIKVLQDETQDNAQTYYRWSTSSREFTYVGKVESKTYTAGNGIDITDDTISVTAPIATFLENNVGNKSVYGLGASTTGANVYNCVAIGPGATAGSSSGTAVGFQTVACGGGVAIGARASTDSSTVDAIAIGAGANANGQGSVQIGYGTNNSANTLQIKSLTLMSADGTIPEARLADTTSATEGQVLQLDSNNNAIWADVDGLPDQTSQAGKILGTDGTNAAWETKTTVSFRTWGVNE